MDQKSNIKEAKIIVTVMGDATSPDGFAEKLGSLELSEIAGMIFDADLIGNHRVVPAVEEVELDQVEHRLGALGYDGWFFDLDMDLETRFYSRGAEIKDPAERISEIRAKQGLEDSAFMGLSQDFIAAAGLSNTFATYLEDRAEPSMEDDFPFS